MSADLFPRTACAPTGAEVARLLATGRFNLSTEYTAQADIDRMFAMTFGLDGYAREFHLRRRDRPDFVIGGCIAVEVKHMRAQRSAISRQLERYAEHPAITELVLATGLSVSLPPRIGGKPLHIVNMGQGWL